MSDPTFETAIYGRSNGSVVTVDSGGTIELLSGGSIQIASGAAVSYAAGASLVTDTATIGTLTLGGTAGRWAFGTSTLTSGTALVYTGLGLVQSAFAAAITTGNNGTGAGTATSFQLDYSRAANGTVYFFGLTGTSAFTGAGTFAWQAFGR